MKNKSMAIILIASSVITACSQKNGESNSSNAVVNSQSISNLPIIGGSFTKELIIRSNTQATSTSNIGMIAGSITSTVNVEDDNGDKKQVIIETLEHARTNHVDVYNNTPSLIKPEYLIDGSAAGITTFASAVGTPAVGLGVSVVTTIGASALKDFIADKSPSDYQKTIETISNKRDTDIAELMVTLDNSILNDIHAGVDPEIVKDKFKRIKEQLLDIPDITPDDISAFEKSSNEKLVFGYLMAINSHDITINRDVKTLTKSIKENNKVLTEIAKNTNDLIENQRKFFKELDKRFNPNEKELFINALFDPNIKSARSDLLNPEQLAFFKAHPEQISVYKEFLKRNSVDSLINLVSIQENSQKSVAYLKAASQIANNLNLNTSIINAVNTGAGVASAISSIASFAITSNPLDALNALSSITGLFSKPKPDPRFTAIFENFKQVQKSLVEIQKQLSEINKRIDNVDDGLSFIIEQNKNISQLIIEQTIKGDDKCNQITDILKSSAKSDLTISALIQRFKINRQGDDSKVDSCIRYLLDTFDGNITTKSAFLKESLSPEEISDDIEVKKYLVTSNQLTTVYSALYPSVATNLKGSQFRPNGLLSAKRVTTHVDNLLNNSFLFDIANVNPNSRQWELVAQNELISTIKQNQKSQVLLENAITLVETAIIQQSVIDGTFENKDTVLNFINFKSDSCSEIKFKSVACASMINPVLMNNMIKKSFKELIGFDFYWSWKQIAENNPDLLNEKLQGTNLSITWVGAGANSLFSGKQLPSQLGFSDGAYVQIKGNPNFYALPNPYSIKDQIQLTTSERVQVLFAYKKLLENELMERNIDKILNADQLNFYNNEKAKMVLQQE